MKTRVWLVVGYAALAGYAGLMTRRANRLSVQVTRLEGLESSLKAEQAEYSFSPKFLSDESLDSIIHPDLKTIWDNPRTIQIQMRLDENQLRIIRDPPLRKIWDYPSPNVRF